MPRERDFSVPDILDRLTDVFITHGYAGTSLALLQDATGLGKQSLYNTFGDKQQMYLQAVDCAVQRASVAIARMTRAENGRAALVLFFDGMIDACADPRATEHNCIVTSGLLEGVEDAELALKLASRWHATHELLRSTIERGQRDGSIASPRPSAELAELLVAMISGLRVAARARRSRAQMESLATLSLSVLDTA